ncbi:hypothetical protein ACGFIK_26185 [Micromonospora sp. NPDC048871]|uniref:hypothetical protein n=1 Tax=Micromonospora sp. NPDC048871 TaxID=3364259 RepID=UPI0037247623
MAEYEAAKASGEGAAILRREGLYHSHILEWRAARDAGALTALGTRKSPVSESRRRSAEAAEIERLRRRNERLVRQPPFEILLVNRGEREAATA